MVIYVGIWGFFDNVLINKVVEWEEVFFNFVKDKYSDLWNLIFEKKDDKFILKLKDDEMMKGLEVVFNVFVVMYFF